MFSQTLNKNLNLWFRFHKHTTGFLAGDLAAFFVGLAALVAFLMAVFLAAAFLLWGLCSLLGRLDYLYSGFLRLRLLCKLKITAGISSLDLLEDSSKKHAFDVGSGKGGNSLFLNLVG